MSAEQLIGLLLGPAGALVLALVALRYQSSQARTQAAALAARYEAEISRLQSLLCAEQMESRATRALLDAEHHARLTELRQTKRELLDLTERTYVTIDHLRRFVLSVTPGPMKSEARAP